jgi:hypothetical protein
LISVWQNLVTEVVLPFTNLIKMIITDLVSILVLHVVVFKI